MGSQKRKYYTGSIKVRVALEAIQERETINQIASRYEVHPNMVTVWKRQLLESLPDVFARKRGRQQKLDSHIEELYQQIGKLKVENDWLKKKHESIRPGKAYAN